MHVRFSSLLGKQLPGWGNNLLFNKYVYPRQFWEEFEGHWSRLSNEQMNLDLQPVLIGVINSKLDYLIVLGKQHLWYCRRNLFPCSHLY